MLKQSKNLSSEFSAVPECGLFRLIMPWMLELFYPEYPYRSGITGALRKICTIYHHMVKKTGPGFSVDDIGSNDGTFLKVRSQWHESAGVRPTNIADIANSKGIETIKNFHS